MSIIEHMSNISEKMRSDDKDRIRRVGKNLAFLFIIFASTNHRNNGKELLQLPATASESEAH